MCMFKVLHLKANECELKNQKEQRTISRSNHKLFLTGSKLNQCLPQRAIRHLMLESFESSKVEMG